MNCSQHDGGTPENVVITDKGGRDNSWNLLQVNFWWVPKLLLFVVSGWGRGDHSTPGSPPCLPFSESFSWFCKRHGLNFSFQTVQYPGEEGFVAVDDVLLSKGSCRTLNCGFQDLDGTPTYCLWENLPAGDSRDWMQQVRIPLYQILTKPLVLERKVSELPSKWTSSRAAWW